MALRRISLAATLALSACAGGPEEEGIVSLVRDAATSLGSDAPRGSEITLSDAELRALETDVLLVGFEDGSEAGFALSNVNRDTRIWRSNDDLTLSTRGGQIAASAGFGADLASAELPAIASGQGRVIRDHYYLAGDERMTRRRYICDLSTAGVELVEVAGRAFETARIDESCVSEDGVPAENTYWIDALGVIRRSRQFVTPEIGYVELGDVQTGLR